jgi:hypothetical protein
MLLQSSTYSFCGQFIAAEAALGLDARPIAPSEAMRNAFTASEFFINMQPPEH